MTEHIDIAPNDLLWLAGLLDGDGCFGFYPSTENGNPTPSIHIQMVDQDTIERVASLFECDTSVNKSKKKTEQDTYRASIRSQKALSLMRLLLPYLSVRRQQKITTIIDTWVPPNRDLKVPESVENLIKMRKTMSCAQIGKLYDVNGETIRMMTKGTYNTQVVKTFRCSNPPQTHTTSIYWLAGLLEAEGSFMKGSSSSPNKPTISIQMTDKDVMEHVSSFFGRVLTPYQPKGQTKDGSRDFKKVYLCQLRGKLSLDLMQKLQPLMSTRRQHQIQQALDSYNPLARKEYFEKKRVIPDGELETIFQKRQQGLPLHQIATQYSVTRNVIRRCLERHTRLEQDQ